MTNLFRILSKKDSRTWAKKNSIHEKMIDELMEKYPKIKKTGFLAYVKNIVHDLEGGLLTKEEFAEDYECSTEDYSKYKKSCIAELNETFSECGVRPDLFLYQS